MFFSSCNTESKHEVSITVLADRTDSKIPNPELSTIRDMIELEKYPNSKVNFTYLTVGNTDFNQAYSSHLGSSSILDNSLQRKAEVSKFFSFIDTLLHRENSQKYDFKRSSILIPLVEQLGELAQEKSTEKILLLYSDISEASDILNVYTKRDKKLLFTQTKELTDILKNEIEIPPLAGVKLYIIYYPRTVEENRMFGKLCHLYEELFMNSGLEVHIGLDKNLTTTIND